MEIRKPIPWFDYYEISNYWKIRSMDVKVNCREGKWWRIHKWRILKQKIDRDGYCKICLYKQTKKTYHIVHRLVYMTFIDPNLQYTSHDDKCLVCHKNDIRDDNRVENLFLWSHQDNENDMVSKKRNVRWERQHLAKLKEIDIYKIRMLFWVWLSRRWISKMFWVAPFTIGQVLRWATRKHI